MTTRRAPILAVVTAAGSAAWVGAQGALHGAARWLPVVAALVAYAVLLAWERNDRSCSRGLVLGCVVVAAVAVGLVPPFGSRDLYQYAMYGRMVTVHHVSPYRHAPMDFAHDPFRRHLAAGWAARRSVYGPVFVALAVGVSAVAGDSALRARLGFQILAAMALIGVVLYGQRVVRAPAWLVLAIGLSPPLLVAVNGGHNDLLASALVVIGVHRATRGRVVSGGLLLAAGVAVNLIVAPVVAAVLVGTWIWGRPRDVRALAAWIVGPLVAVYLVAGGMTALHPALRLGMERARAAMWQPVRRLLGHVGVHGPATPLVAVLVAAVSVALVVAAFRGRASTGDLTLGVMCAVVFGAAYVLPWYAAAVLPLALLARARLPVVVALVGATALLLAYVVPPGQPAGALPGEALAGTVCAIVLAGCVVALALWALRGDDPATVVDAAPDRVSGVAAALGGSQ